MRKTKLNLIAALAVGLLAVSTAGVSTYAWFQAQSQVQIDTTESYTNITVNKPDDAEYSLDTPTIYAYSGNSENNGSGYTYSSNPVTFAASSFVTEVNDFDFDNLWPGNAMTFMISITVEEEDTYYDSISLELTDFTDHTIVERLNCDDSPASVEVAPLISITQAIKIHASYGVIDGTTYYGNSSGNYLDWETVSLADDVDLATKSDDTDVEASVFFLTFEFSEDPETLYKEYQELGCSNEMETTPTSDDDYRFFKQSDEGSSNCYAGLTFDIDTLTIS